MSVAVKVVNINAYTAENLHTLLRPLRIPLPRTVQCILDQSALLLGAMTHVDHPRILPINGVRPIQLGGPIA